MIMLSIALVLIFLGIIYPLCMLALYPIYRFAGGHKSLTKYMKNI